MGNIIQVDGLSKVFQLKTKESGFKGSLKAIVKPEYQMIEAVKGLDFCVEAGESMAFIGPNGAGKSTTIKMLTGILYPTAGKMEVMGLNPVKDRQQLSFNIGSVFGQKSQLWFHLPPKDSFLLLGKIYEIPKERLRQRIDYLTQMFEIESLMTIPVRKMSLGQRIRCEIAASLLHEPRIIFLDEPTIGLDVVVKQRIRDLIKTINKEEGTTIFLTSHDAGDIEELCKRVMVINHGEVVMDDSVKQLKTQYIRKKIINVKYAHAIQLPPMACEVLKQKGYGVKVAVDVEQGHLDEVVGRLMQCGKVVDITIEDPPMEEIITNIYQKQKGGV